ncbi:hypothetical protein Y032_0232g3028 [Ancylostoma ceylanicum]|nr:hypothetical protein Y032_0232g3028 [Ancylostoma ceylanicum]
MSTTVLALWPHNVYDDKFTREPVNYTKINPNNAAWNMTLMRYLNHMEGVKDHFILEEIGCVYSSRFIDLPNYKPLGFCSMKEGNGSYNFFVIGNSFACNQAEMIFKSFGKFARRFDVLCLYACEFMTWTPDDKCKTRLNYTAVIEELKPDVVFVIESDAVAVTVHPKKFSCNCSYSNTQSTANHVIRYENLQHFVLIIFIHFLHNDGVAVEVFRGKAPFNTRDPIDNDKIFKGQMKQITELEDVAKKVYILQAFPSCELRCTSLAHEFTDKGRPLKEIKEGLIGRDDFFARLRIHEIERRCRKCEVIDYLPMLVDGNGLYLGYNPQNNLMYLDRSNHLNRFGKERVQPLFDRLAKTFESFVALDNVTLS